MSQQPFQLTERSFRRYEPVIASIVKAYPAPVSFNPCPLSPNTYAARLRDAIRSLDLYNWKTDLDVIKLKEIRSKIVVQINQHGNIVCGPKGLKDLNVASEPLRTYLTSTATLQNVTDAELVALILLLHNRRIAGVKITGQLTAHVNLACQGYDVEFIEELDGSIVLL